MNVSDYLNTQTRTFAAHLTARAATPSPGVREAARLWVDVWDRYGPVLGIVTDRLADRIPGWSLDLKVVRDPLVVRAYDDARNSLLDFAGLLVELAASSEPTIPGELSLMQEAVLAGRVMELEHAMQRDALEERLSQERSATMDAASRDEAMDAIHRLAEVEREERAQLEARQAEDLRARDAAENERRLELERRQEELQDMAAEREASEALDRENQERIDREAEEKVERERLEEAAREAEREAERQAKERAEQEERAREAREEAERAAKEQAEREAEEREAAEAKEAAEREAAEVKEQAEREAAQAKEQAEQEAREAEERRARERELEEREL